MSLQVRKAQASSIPALSVGECAVVVHYIPKYTPGSGPAMASLSVLPLHDKDGIIVEEYTDKESGPRFLVTYEDKPALRVGVNAENILDWVSARTYEDWTTEQMRFKGIGDEGKAKENTHKKRKHSPVTKIEPPSTTKTRRGRPLKKPKKVEEEPIDISLKSALSPSKQRGLAVMPSEDDDELASEDTPTQVAIDRQFQLDDTGTSENDDENEESFEEPTFMALNRQLKGTPGPSKLRHQELRSPSMSPQAELVAASASAPETEAETGSDDEAKPVKPSKSKKKAVSEQRRRETRSSSRPTTSSSTSSRQSKRQRTSSPPHKDAIAATSSLEANRQLEELEQGAKGKNGDRTSTKPAKTVSIHERYTNIGKEKPSAPKSLKAVKAKEVTQYFAGSLKPRLPQTPPKKSKKKGSKTPEPEPPLSHEENANDDIWEVEAILNDRNMIDRKGNVVVDDGGNEVMEYYIKWVGDEWDPTWEPQENVSDDTIVEYVQKKAKANQPHMRIAYDEAAGDVEDEDKAIATKAGGNGNVKVKGRGTGSSKAPAGDKKAKTFQPRPQSPSQSSVDGDEDDEGDDE